MYSDCFHYLANSKVSYQLLILIFINFQEASLHITCSQELKVQCLLYSNPSLLFSAT